MKKRFLTLIAVAILCFGIIVPSVGSIGALAAADSGATETTKTDQKLDPANLADGKYTIDAPLMKSEKQTASLAQIYFNKQADLSVKNGKYSLTLHLIKDKAMVSDVTTVSDEKAATVTSTGDQTEDLTFEIANLSDVTTLSLTIHPVPTMSMAQKMDVRPDLDTLTAVQPTDSNNQATTTSENDTSSAESNTNSSSSTNASSSAATDQPATNESDAATTTNTNVETDTNETTTTLPTDPITPTNPATTPTDITDNADTTLTQAPLFNPANLSDGTYQIPVNLLKAGTSTASIAASYFSDNATVVVSDNATKITVTLHVIKNANLITAFGISDTAATISNQSATSEDLTFNVDDQFVNPTVSANMAITIPGFNKAMSENADLQFASALYIAPQPSKTTDTSTTNPSGSNTDADNVSTTTEPTSDFDPNNLIDGNYEVPISILQADSDKASVSASFFAPTATVKVSDNTQNVTVTLHITKNASTITAFSIANQNAVVSNQTKDSEDLTFNVDNTFTNAIVTAGMTIKIPVLNTEMKQQARIKFGTALYSKPATDNNNTGEGTTTDKPGSTTDQPGTSTDDGSNSSETTTADLPTFDPTNLKDGQYKIDASILKADSDNASVAASFFDPYATVTVSNNTKTVQVTLHVIKNASTISSFSLAGQNAQISDENTGSENLTFTVDNTFKDPIVGAAMTIKIPVLNTEMNEQARVKFGTALYNSPVTNETNPGKTTDNSGSNKNNNTSIPKKQETKFNLKNPKDGQYKIQAPIMQSDLTTASAAQKFIDKQATIIVSNNGSKIQLVLHLNSGAEYIKQMSIAGQQGTMTNKKGDTADLTFNISTTTLSGIGKTTFNLVTPMGSMSETAYLIFNLSNQSTAKLKALISTQTKSLNGPSRSQRGIIDPTKEVQYVPYKVLDASRTSLSTANNYYTKSAKVVKDGSGYKVFLTVKETAGMVNFTPLSINNGGFTDNSHSTTSGQDVWTYAFHVANENGLANPIAAQIMMSVSIAQITNQKFNIWLAFGKAQTGGTDYLNSNSGSALPASTLALVNSNNTAAPTLLTNTPANKKKVAASANGNHNSASENNKLASVKQYPLIAEIAGFSAAALAIIGFAFYKKYQS
ncbi:hypothetical protein LOOC260_117470 [Paucilactobacillus hokkaidonensis JCM 18461]|uniref:NEAT domain-containing protein n=2 Tax=Paucilactobacillus hokkaidonensis TaxID=1193095 RepID=A0A0A1GZ23_9LACO|nr:NEAT domain-containing protein [Paucilactobacillus hokkaidonensis]BAP86253.1 hypothetical protein LOOC260_117470 [Paucilactobacillus hokkaidonensis JCM 18461]